MISPAAPFRIAFNGAALPSPLRAAYPATGAIVLLLAGLVAATDFSADASLAIGLFQMIVALVVATLLRQLGAARIAMAIEATALLTGFCTAAALLSLVLAASALPFADPLLAEADIAIFGDRMWPRLLMLAHSAPRVMTWLSLIYDTLAVQPLLLIVLLAAAGATERLLVFLLAWMIALALTLAIAPFTPAIAAYLYFGVPRDAIAGLSLHVAWDHLDVLSAVRSGALRQLSMDSLFGVITFPSFHAAGAVLLGWAFAGVRVLRWPFAALNAALFVSAIFVGGHFLIDLVAGTAIAVAAICLAGAIARRRKLPQLRPVDVAMPPLIGPAPTAFAQSQAS